MSTQISGKVAEGRYFARLRKFACYQMRHVMATPTVKAQVGKIVWICGIFALPMSLAFAQENALEEIVVTARKVEQSLQDVHTSVTVLEGERLDRYFITDVVDLQYLAPSLTTADQFGIVRIFMRGLGNTADFGGEDPDVTLYVDGVPIGRPEIQDVAFFDLERVEVLRGPQGTLYGRNSTAGAINLVSAKPTEDLAGYVRTSAGNYDFAELKAAVSGPITERLRGRAAYSIIGRDGFGNNPVTGNDISDLNRQMARGHVLFDAAEDLQFLLTADYASQNDASGQLSFLRESFPGATDPRLVPPGRGGFTEPKSRDSAQDFDPQVDKETWSVTGKIDWQISDRFSANSILSYRDYDFTKVEDGDFSSVRNKLVFKQPASGDQFSAELQLTHEGEVFGRHLRGLAGLFFYDENQKKSFQIASTPQVPDNILFVGEGEIEAKAAFWSMTYDVTNRISLRVGGRFTEEDRRIGNDLFIGPGGVNAPIRLLDVPGDDEEGFSDYTSDVGLDFRVLDNVMLSYTFAEGFKSGAGLLAQVDSPITDPTTVESHEIGLKSQWFDRRLTVNLAGFMTDVKGVQREVNTNDPVQGLITIFSNASGLDTSGFELDGQWSGDRFRIKTGLAYLKAEFTDFLTVDPLDPLSVLDPTAALVQVAGNTPEKSPEWRANILGEYDFTLPNDGTATLGLEASYTGETVHEENSRPIRPIAIEDDYIMLNFNLRYSPAAERWSLTAWGKNLTDQKKIQDMVAAGVTRILGVTLTPPRMLGLTFQYNF